jgi:peroxiredoxin family protein
MTVLTMEKTLEERLEVLEAALHFAGPAPAETDPVAANRVCMVVFSGDLDKLLAALTMATGASAMGTDVCLFFTFWATPILCRAKRSNAKRPMMDRALGRMMGTAMIKRRMRDKQFASCEELLEMARESGVRIRVCDMSMDLMGISGDELIDYPGLERCGVATFMETALHSCVTLFV